jgi:nucleoside-diphosphate-sugar epimerase
MTMTLILGCGYIGRRIARHYLGQGTEVLGLVRTDESAAKLNADGIPAISLDLADEAAGCSALRPAGARLFHLVPPPESGAEDPHTRNLVASFAHDGQPARVVYIGTTGVYGDCSGAWVDEDRPVQPSADRALRRWDAEEALRRWRAASGGSLVILRVAGIYGPGRLPLERIRAGLPVVRPEEAPWSNRIHADDLAVACVAAMDHGTDGALYNACDGNPSTMTDYFLQVADAVGLPRPPVIPLAEAEGRLSAGMLSYLRESRRLSNRRLVEGLGVRLRYPTLAEGLPSCI